MKYLAIVFLVFTAALSFAQCSADPVEGTQCPSPIKGTVKPGQSPTSFVDFAPATVQWPCKAAPVGMFRLCATNGRVAVDVGDGLGYLNLRGKDGLDGKPATIAIGSVSSGTTPFVWNSGTPQDAVLNFTLEKGLQGDRGVIVGTVQTVNLTCPKGKGAVWSGFTVVGCTVTTTAVH